VVSSVPVRAGTNRRHLKKGDRVFGAAIGAFAQYICVSASAIRKAPDALSNETLAALTGGAVSYASVVRIARVQPGETVLVSGASGGLGSICCMVAKAVGARVIALAGNAEKAERMGRDMDVDLVLVLQTGWLDRVMDFTDGRGADVFVDVTGMVNDAIRSLAYSGRIVVIGFAAREGIMEEVKMNKLLLKSITVMGYRFGESGRRHPAMLEDIWTGYLELLERGRVRLPTIHVYGGLDDMGRALSDLHQRKVHGKVVVKVGDDDDDDDDVPIAGKL
jgi:NADPH:quinone reductase-like Zn-dependent oxidoreductase